MLYCQHVLGIGHFFRSMAIARALNGHDVLFIEGGEPLQAFEPPSHVKRLFLPPLMMDPGFTQVVVSPQTNLEDVKAERKRLLMDGFESFSPHVLVTELFPFGRKQFRFELIPLLERIRNERRSTQVLCSLRDILVEKADQRAYEDKVVSLLNAFYDGVLVHSDARLFALEETFSSVSSVRPPIHYTGYVIRDSERELPAPIQDSPFKTIVVSAGGGRVGVDLLASCIRAMATLSDPDLRMRVFLGPFMEASDRTRLKGLASTERRVELLQFSPDFVAELRPAALSISMGGYNTCMDLLTAGTRALVYPFPQNREQRLRAAKLSTFGLIHTLESLDPEAVAGAVTAALAASGPTPAAPIDLTGAQTTARLIEQYGRAADEAGTKTTHANQRPIP